MPPSKIEHASGRAIVVRGDDIDTDRIIPARFLKAITFAGLDAHVFEDERKEATARGMQHPFDQAWFAGAHVLIVNDNFGCGSSREHAPQAIARWGIRAVVGESFAEIFAGNSMMIGLPCVTVSKADAERLMAIVEADPTVTVSVDIREGRVSAGNVTVPATMPASTQQALLSGDWDATGLLLDRYEDVERTARALPYITGFQSS